MIQVRIGFHRTLPLLLHGTSGIGWTHKIEGVGGIRQVGFHSTVPLVLHGTDTMDGHLGLSMLVGQVRFHGTVHLSYMGQVG